MTDIKIASNVSDPPPLSTDDAAQIRAEGQSLRESFVGRTASMDNGYVASAHERAIEAQDRRRERAAVVRVHCSTCDGHGRRPLTEIEAATFGRVGGDWLSTSVIHRAMPKPRPMPTALVNRLNDLVALRLVERRRLGRQVEWRRRE